MTAAETEWIPAGDYFLALEEGAIRARNAKGKDLKSVPAKAKKLPEYEKLEAISTVLTQHKQSCRTEVREWFLKGYPVPLTVLQAVWPDRFWRGNLDNLIVSDGTRQGMLRSVDDTGAHAVDLDGEAVDFDAEALTIPHPVLIAELEEWRELASELGARQGLDQLFREIHRKPVDATGQREAAEAYARAEYEVGGHLIGRGRGNGFRMSMEAATVTVNEGGEQITAELEIYGDEPSYPASLGSLRFRKEDDYLDLKDVGPVAWSEGIRMCEYLYAGRTVKEDA